MKKLLTLFTLILVIVGNCFAQDVKGEWTSWYGLKLSNSVSPYVEISYNVTTCNKGNIIGHSYYRYRSNITSKRGLYTFKFDYMDCDGKIHTEPVFIDVNKKGIQQGSGLYFFGVKVTNFGYGSKYDDPDEKEAENLKTDLDNTQKAFNQNFNDAWNKSQAITDASLRQQYQTALNGFKTDFTASYQQAQQDYKAGNGPYLSIKLGLLKQINSKVTTNLNLMNDVVERQPVAQSNSGQLSNNNSGYQNNVQQQNEQNNTARQQQQEQQRQSQLELLNVTSRQQAKKFEAITDAIGGIADVLINNMLQSSIRDNENQRNKHFAELETLIKTKTGSLVDCSECNGQGYSDCDKCGSKGYNTCTPCNGTGKVTCTFCQGSGISFGKTCSICGGTGTTKCTSCFGKGKNVCTYCNGLGKDQCVYCRGTGKEFKESETVDNNSSLNENNSKSLNTLSTSNASNDQWDTYEKISISPQSVPSVADDYASKRKFKMAFSLYNYVLKWKSDYSAEQVEKAQNMIASYYEQGVGGVEANADSAKKYYAEAAFTNQNYYFELGDKYNNEKNYIEAFKAWKTAADLQDPNHYLSKMVIGATCNNVGMYYFNGTGTTQNTTVALGYFKKAADVNFSPSMFILGQCYENGNGVAKNIPLAIEWYKKAAASNFDDGITQQANAALKRLN